MVQMESQGTDLRERGTVGPCPGGSWKRGGVYKAERPDLQGSLKTVDDKSGRREMVPKSWESEGSLAQRLASETGGRLVVDAIWEVQRTGVGML